MKVVDVDGSPELRRLIAEVRESGEPRVLRHGGEEVAVLSPTPRARPHGRRRRPTSEDREAFLSSAGSWKGLIDADQFMADVRESRRSSRPRVDL